MKGKYLFIWLLVLLFCRCNNPENVKEVSGYPPVYPDYTDITIPVNIAPLNFLLRNNSQAIIVELTGKTTSRTMRFTNKVRFSEKKWQALLEEEQGNKINVRITAKVGGEWIRYASFYWNVTSDRIDPYLSYRLIEPGYEVWNQIQLRERHLESFSERVIADNNLTDGSCMNCHIYGSQDPSLSMFHLRGNNGGTIFNRNGELRKLKIVPEGMSSAAVYGAFHPSGKYVVFSTNIIIPEFHTFRGEKLEVYDTESDLILVDIEENKITVPRILASRAKLETFPVFSADGKSLYFCSADTTTLPANIRELRYDLLKVSFDAASGQVGNRIDTVWQASAAGLSVCHPKTSPDGNYILYTVADYGTFPIWHRETDLHLMDLRSGEIDTLAVVNSELSDTYHSWSSNSRWFVFASKRDDGLYGKPYFCYLDEEGKAHKPFLLPQSDPAWYDYTLKSFNIPELSRGPVPFDAMDIERLYHKEIPEIMKGGKNE